MRILPTRVEQLSRLADDIMALSLKLPQEERLQFLAGQYVDIIMKDGRRRAFSLANAPHNDTVLELHIRRIEGGEFTGHVFDGLKVKDILRIEGPKGSFFLREDSKRPVILLATGTGFAPIKGILEHAFAEGVKRPLHLYWGGRSRESLYLDAQVREWAQAHENFHYVPVLSRPDAGWEGRTGHVQAAAIADLGQTLGEYEVYAAGSPQMVYSARDALVAGGLDPDHYYSDAFEFAEDDTAAKAKAEV